MKEVSTAALWIRNRFIEMYDVEDGYGLNTAFQQELAKHGYEVTLPTVSKIFRDGLNQSTRTEYEIMKKYASLLQCSVGDILRAHGFYDLEIETDLDYPDEAKSIINAVTRAVITGQNDNLDKLAMIAKSLIE